MKPILCNTEVVKNIMAGRQTQDRRPFSKKLMDTMRLAAEIGEISYFMDNGCLRPNDEAYILDFCKRQPGDILYVRETFMLYNHIGTYNGKCPKEAPRDLSVGYKSDGLDEKNLFTWRPSIHMPKWAARTFLKVKRVWVERVQDISDLEARLEGCEGGDRCSPTKEFMNLWDSIYPGSWDKNEWVECCEFELCDKPE